MRGLVAAGLLAGLASAAAGADADQTLRADTLRLLGRLEAPAPAAQAAGAVALGRALFWDTRLSSDGKTACASCHSAQDWSSDRRRFSIDARGKATGRHSQPVFNAMRQASLRWTGDRKTGADQARGSMTGSMGFASVDLALAKLRELDYAPMFHAAYPADSEPLSAINYGRALEAYQATLLTPAAFDEFLAGRDDALDARQKRGLRTFMETGCAGCHGGPLLGGATLQRFGVVRDYWLETGSQKVDHGRFSATKKEEDRYVFRVPMLRNVARTAPYFHDGSVERLDAAIRIMASVQLGRQLDDNAVGDIVAFLDSLTGKVPEHYAPPGQRVARD
jgi:cytochrome c peroxidase